MAEEFKELIEQLQTNNKEEAQRDSNLNKNIAHSRNVNQAGLSELSGRMVVQTEATKVTESDETSAAAKEKQADQESGEKKTRNLLKKIAGGIGGIAGSMKDAAKKGGRKFGDILKGTLFAGLMLALLAFVNSPYWDKFIDIMAKAAGFITKKLVPFFTDLGSLITDFSWEKLKNFFGDHKGALAVFLGLIALKTFGFGTIALAALGAIKFAVLGSLGMVTKGVGFALKKPLELAKTGLKRIASNASNKIGNSLRSVWGATKGKGKKLLDLGMKKGSGLLGIAKRGANSISGALNSIFSTGKGKIAGGAAKSVGGLAKAGGGLLRMLGGAARFAGPLGIAVTAGIGIFGGVTAGIEEYKKTGKLGSAVREGAAGALKALTFGLVSQETFSDGFKAIGDKFDSLTTGVTNMASKAWDGVKTLIPTEEGLKKSFTKLKDNLAPLSEIKLPTEVSFSEIKKSVGTMATALNTSFANITGIDISKTLTSIKDGVASKAKALVTSFENITGIDIGGTLKGIKDGVASKAKDLVKGFEDITGLTVPTFADVKSKIADIGSKLSESFSGLMDDAKGFFGSTTSWMKGLFESTPEATMKGADKEAKKAAKQQAKEADLYNVDFLEMDKKRNEEARKRREKLDKRLQGNYRTTRRREDDETRLRMEQTTLAKRQGLAFSGGGEYGNLPDIKPPTSTRVDTMTQAKQAQNAQKNAGTTVTSVNGPTNVSTEKTNNHYSINQKSLNSNVPTMLTNAL